MKDNRPQAKSSKLHPVALWVSTIFIIVLINITAFQLTFTAFLDVCYDLHEPPNSLTGWTISLSAVLLAGFLGWILRRALALNRALIVAGIALIVVLNAFILWPVSCS